MPAACLSGAPTRSLLAPGQGTAAATPTPRLRRQQPKPRALLRCLLPADSQQPQLRVYLRLRDVLRGQVVTAAACPGLSSSLPLETSAPDTGSKTLTCAAIVQPFFVECEWAMQWRISWLWLKRLGNAVQL